MKYNIAIIGAGQLGSRHLQGLKLAQIPMCIQIVDNSEQSLQIARERYEQVEPNPKIESIEYLTAIDSLSQDLDLVIIATGSKPRAAIISELLAKKAVKNLILEKVLFPTLNQYEQVQALLQTHGLLDHTWINCTRRTFEGYKKLKAELAGAKEINYTKSGTDWGLGCNAIHFIDHYAFLSGDTELPLFDVTQLDPIVHSSKRAGYVEFTGTIKATTSKGNQIAITSASTETPNKLVLIADGVRYDIDEATDQITRNGQLWGKIGMKFQSGLTGIVTEDILLRQHSDLTPYLESTNYHLALLKPLIQFYNQLTGKNEDNCPIT